MSGDGAFLVMTQSGMTATLSLMTRQKRSWIEIFDVDGWGDD